MLQLIGSVYKPQPDDMGEVPHTDALLESAVAHFSTCGSTGGDMADRGATGSVAAMVTASAANNCLSILPFPPSDIGNFNLDDNNYFDQSADLFD